MTNSIVIIAGGLATRLKPITEKIPKSLLDIAGKPFIYWQLKLLKESGFSRVVICAGYLGEQIQSYIKNGEEFGLKVSYSFDGDKLLGTGGAIRKALSLLDDYFYIMYGDSYLEIDYKAINSYFLSHNKKGLMTVMKNDNKWDKSNVVYKNGKIIRYDKKNCTDDMTFIDYGFGILKKDCFENVKDDMVVDLAEIYKELVQKGEILGYEIQNRFYEIGSFKGIEETTNHLKEKYNIA